MVNEKFRTTGMRVIPEYTQITLTRNFKRVRENKASTDNYFIGYSTPQSLQDALKEAREISELYPEASINMEDLSGLARRIKLIRAKDKEKFIWAD